MILDFVVQHPDKQHLGDAPTLRELIQNYYARFFPAEEAQKLSNEYARQIESEFLGGNT